MSTPVIYSDPTIIALYKDMDTPCMIMIFLIFPLFCLGMAWLFDHKKWPEWIPIVIMLPVMVGISCYHVFVHTNTVTQEEQK